MRTFATLAGAAIAGLVFASQEGRAAEVLAPVGLPPAIVEPSSVVGYVEIFGGYDFGNYYSQDGCGGLCEHTQGIVLGGAGNASWLITPTLALQLETWFEHWQNRTSECSDCGYVIGMGQMGIATHLTYVASGRLRAGLLASIGAQEENGVLATAAAEAALNSGRFRFAGQAGFTFGLTGEAGPDGDAGRNPYLRTIATYYARPNLSIATNFGVDYYWEGCEGCDYAELGLTWGSRVEFQPSGGPFSIFLAYQGTDWIDLTEAGRYQVDHYFTAGVSLSFGRGDLQSRDAAVGFGDYNPMYGRTPLLDHI